jgi:hypothetical protein
MSLITEPHFFDPQDRALSPTAAGDEFYEALIATHQELSDGQSEALNARLILLLSNHIGDLQVLHEALALARVSGNAGASPS